MLRFRYSRHTLLHIRLEFKNDFNECDKKLPSFLAGKWWQRRSRGNDMNQLGLHSSPFQNTPSVCHFGYRASFSC